MAYKIQFQKVDHNIHVGHINKISYVKRANWKLYRFLRNYQNCCCYLMSNFFAS